MPYEKGKKDKYYIDAGVLNSVLIKTKLLPMAYYDIDNKHVVFSAETVVPLIDFLNQYTINDRYNLLVKMISDLSKQLFSMNSANIFLIGIELSDIIVIDSNIFVIHNDKLTNKGNTLLVPFKKPLFSSPKIKAINKLPSKIENKDAYYSLALLVIHFLYNVNVSSNNNDTINYNSISSIKGTKMYYFLKRAIDNGILLYI